MRVLIVGSGGREHALAWRLSRDAEVICAPGNPGMAEIECVPGTLADQTEAVVALALERHADLVVVGPEAPLVAGLGSALRSAGVVALGPDSPAARLESDKAFSKQLMQAAGVPTAEGRSFSDVEEAEEFVRTRFGAGRQVVVKASGLALGKGVEVCESVETACEAVRGCLLGNRFGAAGETVVVEDRLIGREFSLMTLVNERGFLSLPVAQDYKRLGANDSGPNTGGMGSFSPVDWVDPGLVEETEQRVVAPVIEALRGSGIGYRGVLFSGLMVVDGAPYCLEYNVRFGDPETQSLVRRMGAGFIEALVATSAGQPIPPIEIESHAAVTVVLASEGYPERPQTGQPISVGPLPEGAIAFWGGVGEGLTVVGGRVAGVSAVGATLEAARQAAYAASKAVSFPGKVVRTDIGAPTPKAREVASSL